MKEIGGYFGLEKLISREYHDGLIPLNNGRNALLYSLRSRNIRKLFIPYYLCGSVSKMLNMNSIEIGYYHIDSEFQPLFEGSLQDNEYLLIVNYYGQLTDEIIIGLKGRYSNIIIDNTQAFFQRPVAGIDTFYSCRKFFGVPDGAYLSTDMKLEMDLKVDISGNRMKHILGRFEGCASNYYKDFKINDASMVHEPLKLMSRLTHNILGAIDYERVMTIRNENYSYLENELSAINKLDLIRPNVPFSYPLHVKNGARIKRSLAEKKIYLPTLWPFVLEIVSEDSLEFQFANDIIHLPVDQRYSMEDMERLVKEVGKYGR